MVIRRHAPADGLRVWAQPDPNTAPFATLPAGQEVELVEETDLGWARVRLGPGQEGWVDGRHLVVPGTEAASPDGSSTGRWLVTAIVAALAIGGGVIGYLVTQDDDGNIVATRAADAPAGDTGETDTGETETGETETGESDSEPPEQVEETEPPDDTEQPEDSEPPEETGEPEEPASAGSFDFPDAVLDQALADGAANPLGEGALPARDEVATARLVGGLAEAGFDLTGLQLTVYRGGSAPSFLLMESDDSAALVNDDAGAETFVPELLASPGVADVDRLVMQHSSSDDQGPFVVTLSLRMDDLREAAETGADVFDRIAVQVER